MNNKILIWVLVIVGLFLIGDGVYGLAYFIDQAKISHQEKVDGMLGTFEEPPEDEIGKYIYEKLESHPEDMERNLRLVAIAQIIIGAGLILLSIIMFNNYKKKGRYGTEIPR